LRLSRESDMTSIDIDLALFGQKASGKTVYAAALVYEIQKRYNRSYYLRNVEDYIEDRIAELQRGEWPSSTQVFADEQVMFDIVKHDNSSHVTYRTIDLPGEIIEGLFIPGENRVVWRKEELRSKRPYREYVERICNLIDKSNAFMFLINPKGCEDENEQLSEDIAQDLMCMEIIHEITRRKNVTTSNHMPPILFVFTQWDLYENRYTEFETYARRVLHFTLGTHARNLGSYELMNCSGIGKAKLERIRNGTGSKTIYKPNPPIEPRGVAETLFWIISSVNSRKKDESREGDEENN
ncbi:MAG: hypothetical protein JW779_14995, partial [Candidatus Thorarchaeota archaeon]|nr:hypothetical protein [Candidatus Thorarchaeota archaeon]